MESPLSAKSFLIYRAALKNCFVVVVLGGLLVYLLCLGLGCFVGFFLAPGTEFIGLLETDYF